jgi:hypothetical protein
MREVRPYGKYFEREERLALNEVIRGRTNAVDTKTLTAGAASTVVTDSRVTQYSRIFLFPTTANAAAELGNGTCYVSSVGDGTYTITHANNAQVDRTFFVLIMTGAE